MAAASEWPWQSLAEAAAAVKARAVSPVELTRACLERIERVDHVVHAFVSVDAEHALQEAQRAEREIKAGHYRGPLHGIPIGLKDNYDTTGVATRNGSRVFADRMSTQDATTWVRLQEAGAILLGKTTMSEAAWGVDFPPVRNPWDVRRNPGLSSGGSGAAVAAGLCFMAMGSDTGGSIRIPAGLSGVVGLKATYGRVSRAGVMPHTWSLDHAGPLSRRVEDAALVLGVIAGHDTRDPASADVPVGDYLSELTRGVRGMRIGVPREHFGADRTARRDSRAPGPARPRGRRRAGQGRLDPPRGHGARRHPRHRDGLRHRLARPVPEAARATGEVHARSSRSHGRREVHLCDGFPQGPAPQAGVD